ncbi:MAG: hypothetical protein II916_08460 [Oscillospiraceae bacterium]|nr:hypothetical protein [Oscillospiraceae bacterium]
MKRVIAVLLLAVLSMMTALTFTGCGSDNSTTDPEVQAYDEYWIRTHDIFGNPR